MNVRSQVPVARRRRRQDGSSLLLVIWATAVMAFAVIGLLGFVGREADVGVGEAKRFRARLVAESALAIASHPAVGRGDPLLAQQVSTTASYEVVRTTEGGRVALNQLAANPWLAGVAGRQFEAWGFDAQESRALVEALADWTDPDTGARDYGAEREVYTALGREDFPWDRPFRSLDEALQVRGMAEVERRVPSWRDHFTVHGGGEIDVNAAGPDLVAAAFDVTPEFAFRFVEARRGPDGAERTWDDTPYETLASVRQALDMDAASFAEARRFLTLHHPVERTEVRVGVGDLVLTLVKLHGGGADSTEERWASPARARGAAGGKAAQR